MWCDIGTYQTIQIMIAFGMFIISLIFLVVNMTRYSKNRKNSHLLDQNPSVAIVLLQFDCYS
ncbi:putative holin-like toxin [Thermoanaerobacterium thermosaccharolyticum]|uniref:putative holin-like toxin n=2 Tax=Thermoanaerobacterium TaxID=28895 RepID=UPI001CC1DD63